MLRTLQNVSVLLKDHRCCGNIEDKIQLFLITLFP